MKTCLVVDDTRVIRKLACQYLEELEFETRQAANGQEALDECKKMMPEAVLLDWNMPVMNGLEFLEELRSIEGGADPKVIFCTTENEVGYIVKALEAGASEYIMKPFDKEILAAKFSEVGLI